MYIKYSYPIFIYGGKSSDGAMKPQKRKYKNDELADISIKRPILQGPCTICTGTFSESSRDNPLPGSQVSKGAPPLSLSQRRILPIQRQPRRAQEQGICWPKGQTNELERENDKLRRQVLAQKEIISKQLGAIIALKEQNADYLRGINQRDERLIKIAKFIITTLQDEYGGDGRAPLIPEGNEALIDEVIGLYADI